MYVLPYGQMSLWGATVITNLMSAIPWVGQDIVESNHFADSCITVYSLSSLLPTIGTVNTNALKKGNKNVRLNKQEYLSIPHCFLSFLVGFIDGDGYIQITKTTKGFIAIKLVISIHLKDISTLEYIRSILNIGKIIIYKDNRSPICKLIINKTDLQEVLFPLLLHHNIFFLTETRNNQFNTAMVILEKDIKMFDNIPNINKIAKLFYLENAVDYAKLSFFKNWIVGYKTPFQYPGLVEFIKNKPLSYKRRKDFKKICSNRESYYVVKKMLFEQYKNVKHYSTYSKPNNREIVVWGSNLSSTVGMGRFTKIVKDMIKLPFYQKKKSVVVGVLLSDGHLASTKPH